ncbi:hypothetical protein, partial [Geobacillus stearothermophilus]|uniref:hypothetical protein n=1 Tax=Geobacillus stearothermophilus TaxID=1422 RepID=UPI003D1AE324
RTFDATFMKNPTLPYDSIDQYAIIQCIFLLLSKKHFILSTMAFLFLLPRSVWQKHPPANENS